MAGRIQNTYQVIRKKLPCGMGGGMPCCGCEDTAHQEPEYGSMRGKRRRGLTADSDGCISEAGKNTAYGEENTDGFPAGNLKRMHIKAAHDGSGREKQPENVYMGKTAHAFTCKTQKEDQGECRSYQFRGGAAADTPSWENKRAACPAKKR